MLSAESVPRCTASIYHIVSKRNTLITLLQAKTAYFPFSLFNLISKSTNLVEGTFKSLRRKKEKGLDGRGFGRIDARVIFFFCETLTMSWARTYLDRFPKMVVLSAGRRPRAHESQKTCRRNDADNFRYYTRELRNRYAGKLYEDSTYGHRQRILAEMVNLTIEKLNAGFVAATLPSRKSDVDKVSTNRVL